MKNNRFYKFITSYNGTEMVRLVVIRSKSRRIYQIKGEGCQILFCKYLNIKYILKCHKRLLIRTFVEIFQLLILFF